MLHFIRNTKESGSITKCTTEESTPGKTAGDTKASTSLTKNMDLEPTSGWMA